MAEDKKTTAEELGIKKCFISGEKIQTPYILMAVNAQSLKDGKTRLAMELKAAWGRGGNDIR